MGLLKCMGTFVGLHIPNSDKSLLRSSDKTRIVSGDNNGQYVVYDL